MAELKSIPEVIAALGGYGAVAALTGRNYKATWMWTKLPSFPSDTYLVMQHALGERDHSAPPTLWGMTPIDVQHEQAKASA
jgi:hypothetical protein